MSAPEQKMLADAEQKARVRLVDAAPAAEIGKDGKKVTRVTYVPEAMKKEIRDQVKQEVLAQAKSERWGEPGALPDWLDRFNFESDIRLRYEQTSFAELVGFFSHDPRGLAVVVDDDRPTGIVTRGSLAELSSHLTADCFASTGGDTSTSDYLVVPTSAQ